MISSKKNSAFGTPEKIAKDENAIVVGIRQRPVAVVGFRRACLAGFQPDPSKFGRLLTMAGIWSDGGRKLLDFVAVSISVARCCRIPTTDHYWIPAIKYQTCV